jgi:hypothetical protein
MARALCSIADYSVSGLTYLPHRLGFRLSLQAHAPMPCKAALVRQATFLAEQLRPLLAQGGAGRRLFCQRGLPHPQYALHAGVDLHRAVAAHRQWAGTGEPERGSQCALPHAGTPARNRLRERPPKVRFVKPYSASSTGSTSLGTTLRPYSPSVFIFSSRRPLCDKFNGLAQVIVQNTQEPGEITLMASAKGIKTGSCKVKTAKVTGRLAIA